MIHGYVRVIKLEKRKKRETFKQITQISFIRTLQEERTKMFYEKVIEV